jgi:Ca2+-binding RTX toxin-like protein
MVSNGFNQIEKYIFGTPNKDSLVGTILKDQINGLAGNDALNGKAGNDELNGGEGNDKLNGGSGDDTMRGGAGNDVYTVDSLSDRVDETDGNGNDAGGIDRVKTTISWTLGKFVENLFLNDQHIKSTDTFIPLNIDGTGNELNNWIRGNEGNNKLYGLGGNDTLDGFGGNDYLEDQEGDNELDGYDGDDILKIDGAAGNNKLWGGEGNDTISALNVTGNNLIRGGFGDDTINLSVGSQLTAVVTQTIFGGFEVDTLTLTLAATPANLSIDLTGKSENRITSGLFNVIADKDIEHFYIKGTGNKVSYISSRGDILYGEVGNNTISAGGGDDIIDVSASTGNNQLVGGVGIDTLTGGSGVDTIVYNNLQEGGDRIGNFDATKDVIQVSASGFGGRLMMGMLASSAFTLGSSAFSSSHRFSFDSSTGDLFFDRDGSGFLHSPNFLANISVSNGSFSAANIRVVA